MTPSDITSQCDVVQSPVFMRRPVASLLLAILLCGFALPLLQAQTTAPACCRRDGRHHCQAPAGPDGFRSRTSCSLLAHPRALTSHGHSVLGASSTAGFAPTVAREAAAVSFVLFLQLSSADNLQRGPPLG